jgi:hypothetical protein
LRTGSFAAFAVQTRPIAGPKFWVRGAGLFTLAGKMRSPGKLPHRVARTPQFRLLRYGLPPFRLFDFGPENGQTNPRPVTSTGLTELPF